MFFAAILIVDFYLLSIFSAKLRTFTKPLFSVQLLYAFRHSYTDGSIMGHA